MYETVSSQDSPVPAGKSPPRARWAKKGGMWKILQGGFRESNAAAGTATEPAVMATPPAKFFSVLGRGYIHVSRAVRDLSGPYQLASGSQIPGKSPCQPVNLPLVGDRRVQFCSRKPESNLTHTHFNLDRLSAVWTGFQRRAITRRRNPPKKEDYTCARRGDLVLRRAG